MKANISPLLPGTFYHIYNRGINGENLFRSDDNYIYFLRKYAYHIPPVAETYAYCLLRNHFHLLIRTREIDSALDGPRKPHPASKAFSDLFNGYAQGVNKAFSRTGGLFETPFRRIAIDNTSYLIHALRYIHQNPQRHGLVNDYREWPYSSYSVFTTERKTRLMREAALEWFGSQNDFETLHQADGRKDGFEKHFAIEFD